MSQDEFQEDWESGVGKGVTKSHCPGYNIYTFLTLLYLSSLSSLPPTFLSEDVQILKTT